MDIEAKTESQWKLEGYTPDEIKAYSVLGLVLTDPEDDERSTLDRVRTFSETFGVAIKDRPHSYSDYRIQLKYLENWVRSLEAQANDLKRASAGFNRSGLGIASQLMIRLQLSLEELAEMWRAVLNGDLEGILDALTDRQYVLDGDYLTFGMGNLKEVAFAEVHRSNMSKLNDEGKPIVDESGRVVKSDQYSPPQLKQLIEDELGGEV